MHPASSRSTFRAHMFQTLLNAIRSDPDDEVRWLALAQYLDNRGDYDLAVVLSAHWRVCRQCLRDGDTVEQAVERVRELSVLDPARLAALSRETDQLGDRP